MATGWLAAASMVLNAGWLLVTQQGWLGASVVVILALVVVLGLLVQRLADLGAAPTLLQRVVVDGTFGLYLGWVSVATCANTTATLVAEGVEPSARVGELLAARHRRGGRRHRRGRGPADRPRRRPRQLSAGLRSDHDRMSTRLDGVRSNRWPRIGRPA